MCDLLTSLTHPVGMAYKLVSLCLPGRMQPVHRPVHFSSVMARTFECADIHIIHKSCPLFRQIPSASTGLLLTHCSHCTVHV